MIVRHSRGQYPIEFLSIQEILGELDRETPIITDANVATAYQTELAPFGKVNILPAGESTKCLSVAEECLDWLSEVGANRKTQLIAFGGGVMGDLVGVVASLFMRGIDFIQIPTTLLAQVDSSIGGKVGVDLKSGKNLAGAFYPPIKVLVAVDALNTLEPRQFTNGAAEIWKYAYIADPALLNELRTEPIHPNSANLSGIIHRCLEIKQGIVERDEFETTGERATLNFGHTVGHAIEHALNYEMLLHGEAVAIGMVAETRLAIQLGLAPSPMLEEITSDMKSQGLPTEIPNHLNTQQLLDAMLRDKKATAGGIACALVEKPGTCKLVQEIPPQAVHDSLRS